MANLCASVSISIAVLFLINFLPRVDFCSVSSALDVANTEEPISIIVVSNSSDVEKTDESTAE